MNVKSWYGPVVVDRSYHHYMQGPPTPWATTITTMASLNLSYS